MEAITELRHSAFSRAELAVVPFQVREGIEGKHTPDPDKVPPGYGGGRQILSLLLRLDRCFLPLLRVDTCILVADFLECTEAFGQIFLPGEEGKSFQGNCLITPTFIAPWVEKGQDKYVH